MLTALCSFILICYVGFWVLAFLIFIFMKTWVFWLILFIILLCIIVFFGLIVLYEKIKKSMINNYSSIWCYCRFNGLKRLDSKDDFRLLNDLAKKNTFGFSKFIFKFRFKNIIRSKNCKKRLEKIFIHKSDELARCIYSKCHDLGISESNFKKDDKVWDIISQTYDVNSELAKELFIRKCCEYKNRILENKEKERLYKKKLLEQKQAEKRKKIEEEINCRRESEEKSFYDEFELSKKIGKNRYSFEKSLKNKLIDFNNIDEKYEMLNIDIGKYSITEFKNFMIPITISCNKKVILLNKKAFIDGTLVVKVLDGKGNLVAEGFINGDNVDSITGIGFNYVTKNILCKCVDKSLIDGRKKYRITVLPLNLWLLEL